MRLEEPLNLSGTEDFLVADTFLEFYEFPTWGRDPDQGKHNVEVYFDNVARVFPKLKGFV